MPTLSAYPGLAAHCVEALIQSRVRVRDGCLQQRVGRARHAEQPSERLPARARGVDDGARRPGMQGLDGAQQVGVHVCESTTYVYSMLPTRASSVAYLQRDL